MQDVQVALHFWPLCLSCILQKYFFLTKDWWQPLVWGMGLLFYTQDPALRIFWVPHHVPILLSVETGCLTASEPKIFKCYPQYPQCLHSNIQVFVYPGKWSSKFSPKCSSESQPRITHAPENALSPLMSASWSFLSLLEVSEPAPLSVAKCVSWAVWL